MSERKKILIMLMSAILLTGIAGALCGCRSTRYVESPSVYVFRDTIRQYTKHTDSLYIHDSVYVDSAVVYKYRTLYRSKTLTDTVYIAKSDTIYVPVEPCEELTAWQRIKIDTYGYCAAALCLCLLWLLRRPILRILQRK